MNTSRDNIDEGTLDNIKKLRKTGKEIEDMTKPLSCLLYTSPSPRDRQKSRMPSSA